jgi:hypothetical protein
MQKTRFARSLVFLLTFSFGGLLLGCSGDQGSKEPTSEQLEARKAKAADFKEAMKQQRAARGLPPPGSTKPR